MSLRAMLWALHDAPCTDPIDKLVLLALADYAGDDGKDVYPSVQTIADTVPCDRVTVQRHLRRLEKAGLQLRGDQQAASHLRADRRPAVYDLPLPERGVRAQPRPVLRGVAEPIHGAAHGASSVQPEPKNQKINQAQRDAITHGMPVGCADHGNRRPACDDCSRTALSVVTVKPASEQARRELAKAARAALR